MGIESFAVGARGGGDIHHDGFARQGGDHRAFPQGDHHGGGGLPSGFPPAAAGHGDGGQWLHRPDNDEWRREATYQHKIVSSPS